jgi:hypothetical protein
MKKYVAKEGFWLAGNFVEAGSEVTLSAAAVKYLGHVVEEPKAPEAVEAVAEKAEEPSLPFDEDKADKPARRKGVANGERE